MKLELIEDDLKLLQVNLLHSASVLLLGAVVLDTVRGPTLAVAVHGVAARDGGGWPDRGAPCPVACSAVVPSGAIVLVARGAVAPVPGASVLAAEAAAHAAGCSSRTGAASRGPVALAQTALATVAPEAAEAPAAGSG